MIKHIYVEMLRLRDFDSIHAAMIKIVTSQMQLHKVRIRSVYHAIRLVSPSEHFCSVLLCVVVE
jgi:hypothetical protein